MFDRSWRQAVEAQDPVRRIVDDHRVFRSGVRAGVSTKPADGVWVDLRLRDEL